MAEKLSTLVDQIKEADDWDKTQNLRDSLDDFPKILSGLSDANWKDIELLLYACVEHGDSDILEGIANKIMDKKKLLDWQKRHHIVDGMCDILIRNASSDTDTEYGRHYSRFAEKLMKFLKTNKLLKSKRQVLVEVMKASLSESREDLPIHQASQSVAADFPWKEENHDIILELFQLVANAVYDSPTMLTDKNKYYSCWMVLIRIFQEGSMPLFLKIKDVVAELFNFCKDQEWSDDEDSEKKTISYSFLKDIMEDYLNRHDSQTEILKPCMDTIKELWECGEEELERDANNIMTAVADNMELAGDQTDTLLERYFSGQEPTLISNFTKLYPKAKEKFFDRFDDLIESMENAESWVELSTLYLLMEMAKDKPEAFTPLGIKAVIDALNGETTVHMSFQILSPLAEKLPADIMQYDNEIISAITRLKGMGTAGLTTLVALSKRSEERARKYMRVMVSMLPDLETIYKTSVMYNMRSVGQEWRDVLAEQRPLLEELMKESGLKDSASSCIDVIEGRSLQTMAAEVTETKQDVEKLEERVDETEDNVNNLGQQVDENTENIMVVQHSVNEQSERLDDLEEVVEETVDKVEELDHKTLSHAPMWARDVAEMLNPSGEHDWRLLASRLGYTNDDIRNWATQANPCLSMFDEWFATHKTREATFAILKQLQEMNDMQAAMIVENALKAAEGIVEDEEEDYVEPPQIFLSYQWGHQDEVKLLKQHLQMAGFEAWMDIGQMGGGDKLFQKIDEGIRAAKVVISCVTEKYAKSPNCNREVNLSVNLGKPIIPLLMENMSWPPPGSMGPIFGEYLYIRFFKDEDDGANVYWPQPVFQELLMQLRYSVVPDATLITEVYKGWTEPPEEIIVVKPRKNKKNALDNNTEKSPSDDTDEMPEIFISYQWGKQPEIKSLYNKLSGRGFHCWLDIMQMGGGDSLYDKIDRGIRNCKVVISCMTRKYSLSPNCRREVSLADVLKKPIIPLLLEEMTWPPEGPMSMVFTQLLYIDFYSLGVEGQKHWDTPNFHEMLEKIENNLPCEVETPQDKKEEVDTVILEPTQTTVNKEDVHAQPVATSAPHGTGAPQTVPITAPKSSCCNIQ